jgi:hypothetical protein
MQDKLFLGLTYAQKMKNDLSGNWHYKNGMPEKGRLLLEFTKETDSLQAQYYLGVL